MNPIEPYEPISCSVHDRLEALAVLGRTIRLVYRTSEEAAERVRSRILDIYASDGAEYLLLESGQRIRLDRIVEFSGPGSAPVIVGSPRFESSAHTGPRRKTTATECWWLASGPGE